MSKEPFMVSEPAENEMLDQWKRKKFVIILGAVLAVTFTAAIASYAISKQDGGEPQGSTAPPRSDSLEDMVSGPDGLLIKHTMCLVRSCKECRKQFPVDPFPSEAKHCECEKWHSKIINATCYMCDEKCWKPDDMIEHGEKGNKLECKNSLPVGITCCLIACIKNMDKPSSIGTFKCYSPEIYNVSKIEPLYHCQHGKTGDSCQKSNDVPFDCKCHTADFNFTNQSEMMDCNSIPTTTYCYTKINSRRCVCNRKPETKSEALKSC